MKNEILSLQPLHRKTCSEDEYAKAEIEFSRYKDLYKSQISSRSSNVADEILEIPPLDNNLFKYYEKYNQKKAGLKVLKDRINADKARINEIETVELPALKEKMDKQYLVIEKFYKEYYPKYAV